MNTLEKTTTLYGLVDETQFVVGPWTAEPDFECGNTKESYIYVICRNPVYGILCGYVCIPEDEEIYVITNELESHWGITWSGELPSGVLEIIQQFNINISNYYCYGFDCGHGFDDNPMFLTISNGMLKLGEYRNFEYVRNECFELSKQIKDIN